MNVVAERVRPTVARVDLGVLKANYRAILEHLARGRPTAAPGVIGVVKANAYGHGAGQVGRALEEAGADLLACADIEEGAALRAAGVRADILIFGALSVSDLDGLFDGRLTPTISSPGAARAVQAAAARYKQRVRYHLKIDTGMNRLGFRFDNLRRTLPELLRSENLD
ncbi:MAG: alanine racemase, partial [Candidatus Rokuibacteriota bacterium]